MEGRKYGRRRVTNLIRHLHLVATSRVNSAFLPEGGGGGGVFQSIHPLPHFASELFSSACVFWLHFSTLPAHRTHNGLPPGGGEKKGKFGTVNHFFLPPLTVFSLLSLYPSFSLIVSCLGSFAIRVRAREGGRHNRTIYRLPIRHSRRNPLPA